MSRDIFVQDLPTDARSVEDIPDDFVPRPIGSRRAIMEGITAAFPSADFSDPTWGRISGDGYSIEVNIGDEDPCEGFALHVHGDEAAEFAVRELLSALDLRALDSHNPTGLFSLDDASLDAFRRWQRYRDRVLDDDHPPDGRAEPGRR